MDNIKMRSTTKFECIVCRLKKDTVAELHRHQTFVHTTEELSLAVIGCQSILVNNTFESKDAALCSWLYDPLKHSEFYVLSAKLLNNSFARFDRSVPLDYVTQKRESLSEDACVPKAGLLENLYEKNFRRRHRYRHLKMLEALKADVLDLSLSKKNRKNKFRSSECNENFFFQNNEETATTAGSKKKKKSSKKTSRKRKPLDVSSIKLEPIPMDDKYDERAAETDKMPVKKVRFADEVLEHEATTVKAQDEEKSENPEENCHDPKKTKEFIPSTINESSNVELALNPSQEHKFLPKFEADYEIKAEEYEAPSEKNRKAEKRKKNHSPRRVGKKSSKKSKKKSFKRENKKTSRGEKPKKSKVDKNFDDRTCLDVPEVHEENDDATEALHEKVETLDVGEEFLFYDGSDLSDYNEDSQLNDFQGVTEFPTYPEDMDEHSILVFDPETRGLVWSSFELVDNDSGSPNNDKSSQDMQNDIQPITNGRTLENHETSVLFNYLIAGKSEQEKTQLFDNGLEQNEALLQSEETSTNPFISQRSKRRRTMPDRYVPS